MNDKDKKLVSSAKAAAMEVLLHNNRGTYHGLPRTAGWGYPEPYTRDLMICSLGVLASGNAKLINTLKKVLRTLAKNQTIHGHIPSLVHDKEDRGASDTTPLFLMGVGLYRKATGDKNFLEEAVAKSLLWMEYQSPSDRFIVAQLPTSDWRDEQWVLGYGLYVNTIVYSYLRLFGLDEKANRVRDEMGRFAITGQSQHRHVHEGLVLKRKPYYAFWSYKIHKSERFDLLGNSLAILSGIAPKTRAVKIITWIEAECENLKKTEMLAVDATPNFFPYVQPDQPDWYKRYAKYNQPGEYHNGGIWPFICGFYISALVAAGRYTLAEEKLIALTNLIRKSRVADVEFGFNEWHRAQDGKPCGQDWQSWSAAMYLYAANCVESGSTPFFDEIRRTGYRE
ncbi:MAG: glycoside hydrolase 100 family protein [Phycisphaerae bacterium]|jgi:hypothetical protein